MRMTLVPGYRDLFGEPDLSYEEIMKDIPSQLGVLIAIALNGELSLPDPDGKVQFRLISKICYRFSFEQKQKLFSAFQQYRTRTKGNYQNEFFERLYLMEMVIRELNRNAIFEVQDTGPLQEYNFLMAYLLIVDEVHKNQQKLRELADMSKKEDLFAFRMVSTGLLYQYQYQEKPDPTYEFYKLASMLNYALLHFRPQLEEYLQGLGFINIGNLMSSFLQVVHKSIETNGDEFLPSLNYFSPLTDVDDSHLKSQAINLNMGKEVKAADLRRFPMFYRPDKGFVVIDQGFNLKKIYRGPFFELRTKTSLGKHMKGDAYISKVAKYVLEEICFKHILQSLKTKKREILLFDDGTTNSPDAYYRFKNTIFLFEFKGYLFPDKQLEKPHFDEFKLYLDERFISNEKNKRKGINQLLYQIELIAKGEIAFDPDLSTNKRNKKIKIYPIICFDDFYFTMPGVNEYLNRIFKENISDDAKEVFDIMPLTMVNLDILFYLSVRKSNFQELETIILRYIAIIKNRIKKHKKTGLAEDLLLCLSGFDEVFHTKIIAEFSGRLPLDAMATLLRMGNITQDTFDAIV